MRVEPSEIFRILGVDTRIKIIDLLKSKGPVGAKYIAEQIGITVAAVSQHLKILKQAGLVTSERNGFRIPYSINSEAMGNCCKILVDVCSCDCSNHEIKTDLPDDIQLLKNYKNQLQEKLRWVEQKINDLSEEK